MRSSLFYLLACWLFISCNNNNRIAPSTSDVTLDLKRGDVISCGAQGDQLFGNVSFVATVPAALQKDFNTGVALLHSFEYDEAEKVFAKIIDMDANLAMAYWGVAMSNFHPLWAPPLPAELEKGAKAVEIARSLQPKTERETSYIEAIAAFYEKKEELDHRSRLFNFEKAMESVYISYPNDIDAAVFYALALNAAADPTDKSHSRQRKAFEILQPIYKQNPLHPGIAHYIIHNMDYPELAELALPAARKYASIAPASAHAQHMPSHIFTRLGLWDECIQSNLVAMSSAQCYAEQTGIKGHWDEELHALDYLVYSYLQKGDTVKAKQYLDYIRSFDQVSPANFKVAYAFSAIPARYALERKDWKQAAALTIHPVNFKWSDFPWQKGITHFARSLGYVHLNNIAAANRELDTLKTLYNVLKDQKNKTSEAAQVVVQIKTAEAWIEYKKGDKAKALELMRVAAEAEDALEKHPVTPGPVIPARELLGEMLLAMEEPALAITAFQNDLKRQTNRRNGLIGLKTAEEKAGTK